jgi:hypothetical protein
MIEARGETTTEATIETATEATVETTTETITGEPEAIPADIKARACGRLRWYPAAWRARYGDEFAELLAADLAERPRSLRRDADIACSGLRARLADVGLTPHAFDRGASPRARLATLACCAAAFMLAAAAMWSQLAIGVSWTHPRHAGVTQALDLMSAALLVCSVLAGLAAIRVGGSVIAAIRRGDGLRLLRPAALIATGATVLFFGAKHFENAWPGTGGHLLVHQSLVPGGVAAFGWAATMWITSYVMHPAALVAFPAGQLAWMALSPAAAGGAIAGTASLLRQLDQSPGALRFELGLARVGGAAMLLFIAGALRWLVSPEPGVMPAFHVGVIDLAALAVLALTVATASQAIRRVQPCQLA